MNKVGEMKNASGNLTQELKQLADALSQIEQRLRLEPEPDVQVLNEFRLAIDNTRLTAWSVSALITTQGTNRARQAALAFVAAERLRRFEQLAKTICSDIENGILTMETVGIRSLTQSLNNLQRLTESAPDVRR